MSNTLGNNLKVTIFGQSHGQAIGCVIDGLCAGIKVDEEFINECLAKRRPSGKEETKRVELDKKWETSITRRICICICLIIGRDCVDFKAELIHQ